MKNRNLRKLPYTCFGVAAYFLLSLFFALMDGQIRGRGPDIFADTDPAAFRTRVIIYAVVGFLGVFAGLLLLLWHVWHSEEQ
jgi:uncharacterized membrane protein YuzA (DUF378 family)